MWSYAYLPEYIYIEKRSLFRQKRSATLHNRELCIILAHGDGAQAALQVVGVDRDLGVGEEHRQAGLPGAGVLQYTGVLYGPPRQTAWFLARVAAG